MSIPQKSLFSLLSCCQNFFTIGRNLAKFWQKISLHSFFWDTVYRPMRGFPILLYCCCWWCMCSLLHLSAAAAAATTRPITTTTTTIPLMPLTPLLYQCYYVNVYLVLTMTQEVMDCEGHQWNIPVESNLHADCFLASVLFVDWWWTPPPPPVCLCELISHHNMHHTRPYHTTTHHTISGGATLWQSSANALPNCCHALPVALPVF